MILASGIGYAVLASHAPETPVVFSLKFAICMIVVQWLASGFGGYMAGRLRDNGNNIRGDEVFFRDTAHGFLSWAVAAIFTALFFAGLKTATVVVQDIPRFEIYTALSMLVGAFIASVAGVCGGLHRDEI
jgi:hypothetical protein